MQQVLVGRSFDVKGLRSFLKPEFGIDESEPANWRYAPSPVLDIM